jgi:RNA polymerase primary sigma factor
MSNAKTPRRPTSSGSTKPKAKPTAKVAKKSSVKAPVRSPAKAAPKPTTKSAPRVPAKATAKSPTTPSPKRMDAPRPRAAVKPAPKTQSAPVAKSAAKERTASLNASTTVPVNTVTKKAAIAAPTASAKSPVAKAPLAASAPKSKPPAMPEVKKRRRGKSTPVGIAPSEPERDILDQYLYEVSTYPLLKGHEEIDLAKKIRGGDQDALQELVKRNLRFVISVAKKYQNRGLPLIDLIGEGNVGLLTAARKFDPDQGVKFISYAVWWIRQAILSSLARQGRTVRVPLNRTADLSRIIKASEILRQKLRREPTPEELSKVTGLSVDVVQSLAALNTGDVRLDAPMDPDGDRSLIERFVADEMPDTEEEAMNRFLNDEIEHALNTLPPRDAKVLRLYFGLEGGREHTLEEIGSMLGVTRERVRQLRDRALKRLREGDVGRALGSFAA